MNLKEKVEKVLEEIRPGLMVDGGNIELVDVNEKGVVKLRLVGACAGCPFSTITLKNYIEENIKKRIPEVKRVEAV